MGLVQVGSSLALLVATCAGHGKYHAQAACGVGCLNFVLDN